MYILRWINPIHTLADDLLVLLPGRTFIKKRPGHVKNGNGKSILHHRNRARRGETISHPSRAASQAVDPRSSAAGDAAQMADTLDCKLFFLWPETRLCAPHVSLGHHNISLPPSDWNGDAPRDASRGSSTPQSTHTLWG